LDDLTRATVSMIRDSGKSLYAIARGSGVNHSQLYRLMRGERGLRPEAILRVAAFLGFEVVLRRKPRRKGR
jgi:hypothetical protein